MEPVSINDRNIVKTSHELNHFRGGYTPLELDFIYAFISCIKNEDDELKEYRLTLEELENKLDRRLQLSKIEYIFDSLITKSFKVHNHKKLTVYSFFTKLEYGKEDGSLAVRFNPELKPHLLKLQTFAMGNLKYILSFRGEYAKRLYMLLSQWRAAGKATYTVDELREMLAVPKSYLYADIKAKVLKKTQTEFRKKAPFTFEFEEQKRSRRVHRITFTLRENLLGLEEFKDTIREEYHDQRLYEFDGKMTYCDEDGKLYWCIVENERVEHIYHDDNYAEACWRHLFKLKDRLPIFRQPSLFSASEMSEEAEQ